MKNWTRRTAAAMMTVFVIAAVFAGCSRQTEETQVQLTRVETQKAARGTLEITGTYIGTVAPHSSVDVTPLVSGTVKTVNVKVGDHVKAGDVLCRFDETAADLQLQSAQNAVDSAKAGKKAAQSQIDAAKKQADASIASIEGQIKTLKSQRSSSKTQLDQLQEALPGLKSAMDDSMEAYLAAKGIYDSSNGLYIQFQAFLNANPDCQTSPGLIAAAYPVNESVQKIPKDQEGMDAETAQIALDESVDPLSLQKQQAAQMLLTALGEIPMTVEYLTDIGLSTLKDQMEQAESASTSAASSYSTAASSVGQLESAIDQLDAQIEALEDNKDAAEDAANTSAGTEAYDAQIKSAETGVDSAQYQKDLYTVKAPIDGIVESVSVFENEISAQGYPAFTISDKEAMEVSFYVPADVRDYLSVGDEIRVETSAGEVKGHITLIGTAVDPQKGLFKVDAQITTVTDKSLLSNTSVSLSLVTNSVKNEILIPFDAVYYDNDQAYVFIAEKGAESDKAVRRDVTAGAYNNDTIAILEGLSEGDRIITTWGAGLKDGAAIEVIDSAGGQNDAQSDTQTP